MSVYVSRARGSSRAARLGREGGRCDDGEHADRDGPERAQLLPPAADPGFPGPSRHRSSTPDALLVLVVSSFTDFVDGYVARKFNQVSRVGQLLDPAADRLFIFSTLIGLAWTQIHPVVARRGDLRAGCAAPGDRLLLANHGYGPLPVHHLGKMGTFALLAAMPVLVLGAAFPHHQRDHPSGRLGGGLWGVFLYWWAGVIYALEAGRLIRIPRDAPAAASDSRGQLRKGMMADDAGRSARSRRRRPRQVGLRERHDGAFHRRFRRAAGGDGGRHLARGAGGDRGAAVRLGSAHRASRPQRGRPLPARRRLTVAGRHPDADIFLDDVTVSRRHAEFVRVGTAFQVHDLGSLNGTYFDGVRIESALLSDGAEVQVGKFRLTFYASRLDLAPTSR